MAYNKRCIVPQCPNTSRKTPEKLFLCVPRKANLRKKWLQLARRHPNDLRVNSSAFFCEDHFNIEKDIANFNQYKMGFSQRLVIKDGVLPSKFSCQQDRSKRLCDASFSRGAYIKRRRLELVQECLNKTFILENTSGTIKHTDNEIEEEVVASKLIVGGGDEADAGVAYFVDEGGKYYYLSGDSQQLVSLPNKGDEESLAYFVDEGGNYYYISGDSQNLVSLHNKGDEESLKPTDMDKQTETEIDLGVADNVVVKNEEADESTLVVEETTLIKEEPLDQDGLQTCHNAYDSYFEVIKHEYTDNSSEMKTLSENHVDLVTTKQESLAVVRLAGCAPTPDKPLAAVGKDETSPVGEVCFESKTQQSLQKAEDTDNCGLLTPMATHSSKKLFTSEHCLYKSVNKKVLIDHMRTHTREKRFTCEVCNYKCARSTALKTHMRTHTGEKPYTCKHCDYKCAHSSSLKNHMMIHTGEKPYSCKQCDYKCSQSNNLRIHMSVHTGEKPFNCSVCNYKCVTKSLLMRHMRTHTGEKPYTCKYCDYKCALSSSLKYHMMKHTGQEPHSCKHCDYKCERSGDLDIHMRTHSGKKPFNCGVCNKCKTRSSLLPLKRTHADSNKR